MSCGGNLKNWGRSGVFAVLPVFIGGLDDDIYCWLFVKKIATLASFFEMQLRLGFIVNMVALPNYHIQTLRHILWWSTLWLFLKSSIGRDERCCLRRGLGILWSPRSGLEETCHRSKFLVLWLCWAFEVLSLQKEVVRKMEFGKRSHGCLLGSHLNHNGNATEVFSPFFSSIHLTWLTWSDTRLWWSSGLSLDS